MTLRLDRHLVETGLASTRSRAADAIRRGRVRVDGRVAQKAGERVGAASAVVLDDPAAAYVSRAALKLAAGLDAGEIAVEGRAALDVGASTGGFTQVLLERGAFHVTALDVGTDQLDPALRANDRVLDLSPHNARDLRAADLPHPPGVVVSDVSFISLTLALPPALALAAPGADCVLLVKPQFEAGPKGRGKGGIVAPERAEAIAEELRRWLHALPGWRARALVPSPIRGGDGNREFLLVGRKDAP